MSPWPLLTRRKTGPVLSHRVAAQQAVFSLDLGISFAPDHKGMPFIESATAAGFARRQVITARNIRDFCAATDLTYREENFIESFRQILRHLGEAGAAASRRPD